MALRCKELGKFAEGQDSRFWFDCASVLPPGVTLASAAVSSWAPTGKLRAITPPTVQDAAKGIVVAKIDKAPGGTLVVGEKIVLTLTVSDSDGDTVPFEAVFEIV